MSSIISDIRQYLVVKIKYPKKWPRSAIESVLPKGLFIEEPVEIKKGVLISAALNSIGSHTYIGNLASVYECESIGRFCSISHGVKLGVSNHALNHVSTNAYFYSKTKGWLNESTFTDQEYNRCMVENDVLISANAIILNGVRLSTGCVVAAGAFVNKDVPPYAIVGGAPAKIIKYRFNEDVIKLLLESKWWELRENQLMALKEYFNNPAEFVRVIHEK